MSQGLYLPGPISPTQLFQDFRPRVCSVWASSPGGRLKHDSLVVVRHIYSSNNNWCELVPQLQIGTPNQSLSTGFFSKFAKHKPKAHPFLLSNSQYIIQTKIKVLEDRLPRAMNPMKTVILFFGRGGIQPFPGK